MDYMKGGGVSKDKWSSQGFNAMLDFKVLCRCSSHFQSKYLTKEQGERATGGRRIVGQVC